MQISNRNFIRAAVAAMALFASGGSFGQAPANPQFKFSTPIAPGVAVPDRIESSIGTLNLSHGYPKPDTVEKIYDNLDRSRALQAYLMAIPIVTDRCIGLARRSQRISNTAHRELDDRFSTCSAVPET